MATSFVQYTNVTAGDVDHDITFDVLDSTHIKAKINGVVTTAFTLNTALTVLTFSNAGDVPEGATVRLYRETPTTKDRRLVDWTSSSTIREADLDTAHLQDLYVAEEALDKAAEVEATTSAFQTLIDAGLIQPNATSLQWDAVGKRLTNLAAAVNSADAVRKAELDQVILDGGGVTAAQRAAIDAAVPLGGSGSEFRQLMSVVDVQEATSESGFQAGLTTAAAAGTSKVSHFYIGRGALKYGGTFRLLVSGRITGETIGPALTVKVAHNGTIFGHDDAGRNLGYTIGNNWNSAARIIRYPANCRWILDMEAISMGGNADLPDSSGDLGHNMLCRGHMSIECFSWSTGDAALGNAGVTTITEGGWDSGTAYVETNEVIHHGRAYVCMAATTGDEPGTLAGDQYWLPKILKYRINHMAAWDHTVLNEVTIEIGHAYQNNIDGYITGGGGINGEGAWISGTAYSRGDGVDSSGKNYVCHTPTDASDVTAPTAARDDHWEEVTLRDSIFIDTAQAYFFGAGATGIRPLTF